MTRRTKGEGSVYMRKDGRAAASAIYEGKRITKYGKTKTEARQKLDAYLDDLKAGRVVIGPKQTVEQYLTHWLEDSRRLKIEPGTFENYRYTLRAHLLPAFGHLQLNQLTKERVQEFYASKLDAGYAPSTIKVMHSLLSSALRDAVADGLLARNVCDYVTVPKQKKRKPYTLNGDQCKRLLEAARGRRLWLMILMAITTGARVGELCALRWSDIDVKNQRIHIHRSVHVVVGRGLVEKEPKTASGARRVVLAQVVADALPEQQAYIERLRLRAGFAWKDLGLVFPGVRGNYLRDGRILDEFRMILAEVGLPLKMHFHDLRHSAATLLFAAGVNPKVVSEALGHSSVSITLGLYGDVTPDMQDETGRVMDNLFE
ncbi:MAG TPA: tyrosine-type recombinase/integrase [Ktedonobacteraceae bacterium]|nr:tyrosine-type recombinase/integrase [Ktedonobacteraceae bacterium]